MKRIKTSTRSTMSEERFSDQPRSQGLSLERETLVAAGHVPPRIWVVTKNSLKGGRLRLLLSILSLQESVKCCHQNKHFFHVAPVCCITVMSQCNTVQTPKQTYQSSNNRNPSCCRLCGLVIKDVNYCKKSICGSQQAIACRG